MFRHPQRLAAPTAILAALTLAAVPATAVAAPAVAAPGATTPSSSPEQQLVHGLRDPFPQIELPERVELPDAFQPEGITTAGPYAWFGSRADGDIYRADLVTGEGEVISQGPGTPSVGLTVDARGRLFVSGGTGGDARVVDARSGEALATYDFGGGFVNDVVVTRDYAYFTDSQLPVVHRLHLGPGGKPTGTFDELALHGDWEQVDGFNANGITTSPDGKSLLVVNSTTGALFRVDPDDGHAHRVDLGDDVLTHGDGMLRVGRTLHVARNQLNQVATVRLDRSASRGEVVRTRTSDDFDTPTTIARFAGALYLPNARFTTPPDDSTEYWVTRLPLH
jgi:sugar lactone lactonase YvrE